MTPAEAHAVLLAERKALIAELRRRKRAGATHIAIAEVLELLGERS